MAGLDATISQLLSTTPEDAARQMTAHFEGDSRKAEAEAWRLWDRLAGGDAIRGRPNEDSFEAKTLVKIAIACSALPAMAYA